MHFLSVREMRGTTRPDVVSRITPLQVVRTRTRRCCRPLFVAHAFLRCLLVNNLVVTSASVVHLWHLRVSGRGGGVADAVETEALVRGRGDRPLLPVRLHGMSSSSASRRWGGGWSGPRRLLARLHRHPPRLFVVLPRASFAPRRLQRIGQFSARSRKDPRPRRWLRPRADSLWGHFSEDKAASSACSSPARLVARESRPSANDKSARSSQASFFWRPRWSPLRDAEREREGHRPRPTAVTTCERTAPFRALSYLRLWHWKWTGRRANHRLWGGKPTDEASGTRPGELEVKQTWNMALLIESERR